MANGGDLCEWLHDTDFVVDRHDRNEERPVVYRVRQHVEVHGAVPFYRQHTRFEITSAQVDDSLENRSVLGRKRDQSPPTRRSSRGRAAQRKIAGFGRSRSKDHALGVGSHQRRYLTTCLVYGVCRLAAIRVLTTVRVAEQFEYLCHRA